VQTYEKINNPSTRTKNLLVLGLIYFLAPPKTNPNINESMLKLI